MCDNRPHSIDGVVTYTLGAFPPAFDFGAPLSVCGAAAQHGSLGQSSARPSATLFAAAADRTGLRAAALGGGGRAVAECGADALGTPEELTLGIWKTSISI